ncbi:MAG: hypothetical protein K6F09_04680 [Clostridiales bacterium]|nr:hypothetical protein [Clostridiales bacterium]
MFNIGDTVVYGTTGVCTVEDIKPLTGVRGADKKKLYYVLDPMFRKEKIYSPVDSDKIFIRRVMTREEAEHLIDMIPDIKAEFCTESKVQELSEYYKEKLRTHDSEALVEVTKSIYAKKKYVEEHKRKIGQIDETYMKQAEELLFGELSVALSMDMDEVKDYIVERVGNMTGDMPTENDR